MSLYGAFDTHNHFGELANPQVTASGTLTPAQRRATCLSNLMGSGVVAPGTVTTTATTAVVEKFDGVWNWTELTMTAFAVGTSGDNANLAIGAKFYTLPAGAFIVQDMVLSGGITAAISVTTDTPELGVGSVIGSGANATLSTTMEDYIDGGAAGLIGGVAIAPDVAGTAFTKGMLSTSNQGIFIAASGGKARDMFLNVADGWADVAAAGAVTYTGTIKFRWRAV